MKLAADPLYAQGDFGPDAISTPMGVRFGFGGYACRIARCESVAMNAANIFIANAYALPLVETGFRFVEIGSGRLAWLLGCQPPEQPPC